MKKTANFGSAIALLAIATFGIAQSESGSELPDQFAKVVLHVEGMT